MHDWSAAAYVIAAIVAVVAVLVVVLLRSRTGKRSASRPHVPSSAVDPFYLDSSHAGEPRTLDGSSR
jgi:hypothetical protein